MWTDLKKQLDWFEKIGVEKFNLAVLKKGMVGHNLPRRAGEVVGVAGWAWAQNLEGLNVYFRPSSQAWPFIFLDDLDKKTATAIEKKYTSLVLETSQDNHQAWVQTSQILAVSQRAMVQKLVAAKVGADPGSTSGDHFGRATGFLNRKPGRGDWPVRVVAATHHHPLDTQVLLKQTPPLPAGRGECASGVAQAGADESRDESRKEFGWACGWLRAGCDMEDGVRRLTARAIERGKRADAGAARAYAEKTFEKAAAVSRGRDY